jgi:hypothetical protein
MYGSVTFLREWLPVLFQAGWLAVAGNDGNYLSAIPGKYYTF